jgi:hypothetical protein
VQRHLLLVAEPPRGHGAERQLLRQPILESYRRRPSGRRFCFGLAAGLSPLPRAGRGKEPHAGWNATASVIQFPHDHDGFEKPDGARSDLARRGAG